MANLVRIKAFRESLRKLLPKGLAWVLRPDGVFWRMLEAIAAEIDRIYERATALRREKPGTTVELLDEWEKFLKLPDPAVAATLALTADQRRLQVIAKLGAPVSQTPAGLEEYAARLGYDVDIVESGAFVVSSPTGFPPTGIGAMGDPLNDEQWAYVFYVRGPDNLIHPFLVDISAVGDSLGEWGNLALEVAINIVKPSHTVAIFEYT